MTKLYLDIDGVLLQKDGRLPDGAVEFLYFAVAHFECYWLTTHCKGDATTAVRYLMRYYPLECQSLFSSIRPTTWDAMKTEGIDFSSPFYWLDDQPFESERRVFAANGVSEALIVVDLRNTNELDRIRGLLKKRPAV